MRDERVRAVGLFAARDQGTKAQDHLRFGQVLVVDADRLQAVFQGRIQARQRVMSGQRIIGQGGDREDIVAGQLVDETGDAGDVVRASASFLTCDRVQDIGR